MQIFVAGATGVLGRRLVAEFSGRGYDVVGLVRDEAGAGAVRARDGVPVYGDVLERPSLHEAVGPETDAVIHAATAIPTDANPSAADWRRNDRVRVEGTRNLLDAAVAAGADRFYFQSVVWVARQPDGSEFDEDSQPQPDRTTESALEAERLLRAGTDDRDLDGCTLRCGWFYAPDATHTRRLGEALLAGKMPIVGGGGFGRRDAVLSILHADDAASAFATAAERGLTGLYHVVDEEPVTFADFLEKLAAELGTTRPRRLPGWLARYAIGQDSVRLLTNSMPTSADRFRAATGWEPSKPTYREGIERVVERWRADGTIARTGDGYEWVGDDKTARRAHG